MFLMFMRSTLHQHAPNVFCFMLKKTWETRKVCVEVWKWYYFTKYWCVVGSHLFIFATILYTVWTALMPSWPPFQGVTNDAKSIRGRGQFLIRVTGICVSFYIENISAWWKESSYKARPYTIVSLACWEALERNVWTVDVWPIFTMHI